MKIRKKCLYIFLVIILGAVTLIVFSKRNVSTQGNHIAILSTNGNKIKAEVVFDPYRMELGLGGRESLCQNCGMLFLFSQEGGHSFWMKDMKFDLDIIWINNNRIVHIEKKVQAGFDGILSPKESADRVLELYAGSCDRMKIKEGDVIETI